MSEVRPEKKTGAWSKAREMAERTPETRNRYVDFLRAASITVVVVGHWLMSAPIVRDGELKLDDMLATAPWSQWLTWVCQVMPLFFIVGGYSNMVSWDSARRRGEGYGLWTATRLKRLMGPVVPLMVMWAVMAIVAHRFGVRPTYIRVGSQVALIPTWFLAVYVMVTVAAPGTSWAWHRFGMLSFWVPALCAVVVDTIAFSIGFSTLRWVNYAFVWLSVHQLGYLWRDGRIAGPVRALSWAVAGLAVLMFLIWAASYPVSMISVPDELISNSRPPTLALLALGALHAGIVLLMETPMRRWLRRPGPWTATVFVNGTIMTVYLWHNTVMVLMIGLLNLLGGVGLTFEPDTAVWWMTRPLWIGLLGAILAVIFVPVFNRFERRARAGAAETLSVWRTIGGAAAACFGLSILAMKGIYAEGRLGIRIWTVLLVLAGATLVLGLPRRRAPVSGGG